MTATPTSTRWPLARILILVLAAGFLGLMTDIRVEHVDIVRETWEGWIPIAYAGAMAVVCLIAAICWGKTTRRIMLAVFLTAFIVGGLGFYFHNAQHLTRVPGDTLHAWTDLKMKRLRGPPELAPMSFAGLGLLGVLACFRRFN